MTGVVLSNGESGVSGRKEELTQSAQRQRHRVNGEITAKRTGRGTREIVVAKTPCIIIRNEFEEVRWKSYACFPRCGSGRRGFAGRRAVVGEEKKDLTQRRRGLREKSKPNYREPTRKTG
jgi:hypothetical protein